MLHQLAPRSTGYMIGVLCRAR